MRPRSTDQIDRPKNVPIDEILVVEFPFVHDLVAFRHAVSSAVIALAVPHEVNRLVAGVQIVTVDEHPARGNLVQKRKPIPMRSYSNHLNNPARSNEAARQCYRTVALLVFAV